MESILRTWLSPTNKEKTQQDKTLKIMQSNKTAMAVFNKMKPRAIVAKVPPHILSITKSENFSEKTKGIKLSDYIVRIDGWSGTAYICSK